MDISKYKIGLALSGGGARGLAHIGVLKAFHRQGIPIDFISGTSMGGIIAGAYAVGHSPESIEAFIHTTSKLSELIRLVDITLPRRGLLQGQKIRDLLKYFFGEHQTFEKTKIPLAINAVDLNSCEEVVFNSGPLLPAIYSTISIPGLFPPVENNHQRLADGGIINNLPVSLVKHLGANFIVAVDVQTQLEDEESFQKHNKIGNWPTSFPDSFIDFYRAELIMIAEITKARMEKNPPDILIKPDISPEITMLWGFHKAQEIIDAGERSALEKLNSLSAEIFVSK